MDMYNPLIGSLIINMSFSGGRYLYQCLHLVAGHRYLFTSPTLHVYETTRALVNKCRCEHACLLQLTL